MSLWIKKQRQKRIDLYCMLTLTSLDAISDLANSTGVANATVEARITVVGAAARNATAAPANTSDPNMAKNTFIVVGRYECRRSEE
jgi:hypothetical protein